MAAIRLADEHARVGGHHVLKGVSLECGGEIVALVGANGSGKSTLLRVLATLRPTASGDVFVAGLDATERRNGCAIRSAIGYLPQSPGFASGFTVREALEYAAWLHRLGTRQRRVAVDAALRELDLCEYERRQLSTLSGGTRQRVHIGQAIVHRPAVLLLDEPTTGVDAEHRVDLRRLLRVIARNRLVMLSTHLTEDMELLADRVVALAGGRVVFDGSPGQLAGLGAALGSDDSRSIERGLRSVQG